MIPITEGTNNFSKHRLEFRHPVDNNSLRKVSINLQGARCNKDEDDHWSHTRCESLKMYTDLFSVG
jgi:hypothetical protein